MSYEMRHMVQIEMELRAEILRLKAKANEESESCYRMMISQSHEITSLKGFITELADTVEFYAPCANHGLIQRARAITGEGS